MNLNIREMVEGNVVRLRYVFRYSTSRVGCPESVAEHSYFVALYSMLVTDWFNTQPNTWRNGILLDSGFILQRAIMHDIEEARTGDVPRPFKYSSNELRTMLSKAGERACAQVVEPLIGQRFEHEDVLRLFDRWYNAKDESMEGHVIEFADFLSVLSFMSQEGAGQGNRAIVRHVADMNEYFARFSGNEYTFIRPLVGQADAIMKELF